MLSNLDDLTGFDKQIKKNHAKWHPYCKAKFTQNLVSLNHPAVRKNKSTHFG